MNTKLTENPDIPVLDEWISLTEAAAILEVSRQYVNKRAAANGYKTLHRLGNSPAFVVKRSEIDAIKKAHEPREEPQQEEIQEII